MITRRHLIQSAAATAATSAGATLLGRGRASEPEPVAPEDLRFIFVFLWGGWDVTRAFAPMFDNANVATESNASTYSFADGFTFVDSPERPSVLSFFETWRSRSVIINGIGLAAIDHFTNLRLILTGANDASLADWPAILAGAATDDQGASLYPLPHLVLAGPSFAGRHGDKVVRAGGAGQLEAMLTGAILDQHDDCDPECAWGKPDLVQEQAIDRYLRGRARAEVAAASTERAAARQAELLSAFTLGASLKELARVVEWDLGGAGPGTSLGVDGLLGDDEASLIGQLGVAVSALSRGASRCVTVQDLNHTWDTHTRNFEQSENFEALFQALNYLMERLEAAPGRATARLADETVVVVLSEMGRSPQTNNDKDHWPYTSALLIGPGLDGGRVIGGFDELFCGMPVNLETGEVDLEAGTRITPAVLGATLLSLAGLDPDHEDYPTGYEPIWGVLTAV